jgi:SAM-dependent methyltransferase
MPFQQLKTGQFVTDEIFNRIYPEQMQETAEFHFTPVEVALEAARFLVDKPGTRVLDIGSGAGKFCMIGAASTQGYFVGVEQRLHLHEMALVLSEKYHLDRLEFRHANILDIQLQDFDAVYIFNPFYEHISSDYPIDQSIPLDRAFYAKYCAYTRTQLNLMPTGTRLVSYFSYLDEIPANYSIQTQAFDSKLKMWVKSE